MIVGDQGDRIEPAGERQSVSAAGRLDMPGPLQSADFLLTQLTADVKHAHPLTIREAEIATLVATGMSNRQIAQQFVLSERTIESHIRNIWASRTSPVAQTSPAGSGTTPRRHACAETV